MIVVNLWDIVAFFDITRIGNLHANSIYFIQNKRKK